MSFFPLLAFEDIGSTGVCACVNLGVSSIRDNTYGNYLQKRIVLARLSAD